jgi:DNA-binding XRE family transcriptional regulator
MTYTEPVRSYIRAHRRAWALSQKELARVLGITKTHISRLENGKCAPSMRSALACQVLFGIPPATMFPHTYDRVEDRVIREVYQRHEALSATTNPAAVRKRELYALALERAATPSDDSDGHGT